MRSHWRVLGREVTWSDWHLSKTTGLLGGEGRGDLWRGCCISQAGDSGGLDQGVAVKMVRRGQIQGALWRERQLITFNRAERNTNSLKHQRNSQGNYWLIKVQNYWCFSTGLMPAFAIGPLRGRMGIQREAIFTLKWMIQCFFNRHVFCWEPFHRLYTAFETFCVIGPSSGHLILSMSLTPCFWLQYN